VEEWLANIKMSQYWEVFRDNGFDSLETLSGLDNTMLEAIASKWWVIGYCYVKK
jgi:hypothetical protein